MNTTQQPNTQTRSWATTAQNLGFSGTQGFVDDAALIQAGFEEVIDILDDGEMVLTQLTPAEKSSQAA